MTSHINIDCDSWQTTFFRVHDWNAFCYFLHIGRCYKTITRIISPNEGWRHVEIYLSLHRAPSVQTDETHTPFQIEPIRVIWQVLTHPSILFWRQVVALDCWTVHSSWSGMLLRFCWHWFFVFSLVVTDGSDCFRIILDEYIAKAFITLDANNHAGS